VEKVKKRPKKTPIIPPGCRNRAGSLEKKKKRRRKRSCSKGEDLKGSCWSKKKGKLRKEGSKEEKKLENDPLKEKRSRLFIKQRDKSVPEKKTPRGAEKEGKPKT